ncbi:MAG: NAD(P)/FAD-dependent oxidoreductase [Ardenticatenia bacterium]|nr:NAD(P)/FAD-dependent oxidoreductase [Ardenticatenia bacterium]
MGPHTIVVLGAGYAGLRCVFTLLHARQQGLLDFPLVLVERHKYHQLVTWLHEVACDAIPAERARIPLTRLISDDQVKLVHAEVTGLDPERRLVITDTEPVPYGRLVVALGSEPAWPPIPGLRDHALTLRWWDHAVQIQAHVCEQFAKAGRTRSRGARRRLARIVIAGGGFTGCQLAGEFAHWVPVLADTHGVPLEDVHVVLVEAEDRLLPTWRRRIGKRAEQVLRRKGVDVRLGTSLEGAGPDGVVIGGEKVESTTLIWTGGIQAPSFLKAAGLPTGPQGRVHTDAFLRASGFHDLYVAGDCALTVDGRGHMLPATAAQALRQGEHVAKVLLAEAAGTPPPPYRARHLAMFVSLGGGDAVGDFFGVPLRGRAAGLIKDGVERWYHNTITSALASRGTEE